MRIPLDYYRILSVPVKANSAQLEQAYNDRLLQQPRREYSEDAVAARQQLIQYSYQVLSSPEQRASYDAQFLLNMQPLATPEFLEQNEGSIKVATSVVTESGTDVDQGESLPLVAEVPEEISTVAPANPTIDIAANQIVGALLILHELGEYEIVLSLGIDDFNRREAKQRSLVAEDELSLDTTQEDLILVLALAYMELGREQWHRREYENAALSAQLGVDLLQQKSLFPHLQLELEQDLAKLRPYRVLELISQNPVNSAARTEGFALLQSMLMQRQGIEGKGEDRSGLNFEQFLRFIQQLRTYLTSSEQQQLFDNDSQSKSAIANYLAVYALLGRGFCLKQPELILRAQRKLDYLSEKQDVVGLRDNPQNKDAILESILAAVQTAFTQNQTAVIYTSRAELSFDDVAQRLQFGMAVSALLMEVVQGLPPDLSFLISKGGITSNDVLSVGLKLTQARLLGQILPGCSVIRTEPDHPQFPNLPVVLFPGNVGDQDSLVAAWQRLTIS